MGGKCIIKISVVWRGTKRDGPGRGTARINNPRVPSRLRYWVGPVVIRAKRVTFSDNDTRDPNRDSPAATLQAISIYRRLKIVHFVRKVFSENPSTWKELNPDKLELRNGIIRGTDCQLEGRGRGVLFPRKGIPLVVSFSMQPWNPRALPATS